MNYNSVHSVSTKSWSSTVAFREAADTEKTNVVNAVSTINSGSQRKQPLMSESRVVMFPKAPSLPPANLLPLLHFTKRHLASNSECTSLISAFHTYQSILWFYKIFRRGTIFWAKKKLNSPRKEKTLSKVFHDNTLAARGTAPAIRARRPCLSVYRYRRKRSTTSKWTYI